ncbi:MAG TPA: HAMP domain-containing sensor histidine kinase, partial [Vicinamibacteria bacterium]|nr:HAMP domain-containing sensor histidine kinase [Vicinamibacteria bacterium]
SSATRLIALVNDLLDVASLEQGRIKIEPRLVDLGAVTRAVLADVAALVAEKEHAVSVEGADVALTTQSDPQLLGQVVLNLVANAIKYTPPGGSLSIAMGRTANGALRWEIRDTGIGIPLAAQARLFEKFYRADNAATLETEGTGLGLYLVRLIVERLGGRVWSQSQEGVGSTFGFTLPAAEAA